MARGEAVRLHINAAKLCHTQSKQGRHLWLPLNPYELWTLMYGRVFIRSNTLTPPVEEGASAGQTEEQLMGLTCKRETPDAPSCYEPQNGNQDITRIAKIR